jgi:hypothetical protein
MYKDNHERRMKEEIEGKGWIEKRKNMCNGIMNLKVLHY